MSTLKETNPSTLDYAVEKSNSTSTESVKTTEKGGTLRGRLLRNVLPTVLVPLAVAGGLGWLTVNRSTADQYRTSLEEQSLLASEASSEVLSSVRELPQTVTTNPVIIEATREASDQVEQETLTELSPQALQERFGATNLIENNPALNTYLKELAGPDRISEMVLTERNGFNVAYNQPTIRNVVQTDQNWWETVSQGEEWIGNLQFNEVTKRAEIQLVQPITDPETEEFLGALSVGIPASIFQVVQNYLGLTNIQPTTQIQILDTTSNNLFATVTADGVISREEVEGGETIEAVAAAIVEALQTNDPQGRMDNLSGEYNLEQASVESYTPQPGQRGLLASLVYDGRTYRIATVPETDWVAISSLDNQVLAAAGGDLITLFVIVGGILGVGAVGVVLFLANGLSTPLSNVTQSAQKAAGGDLSARAQPQGSQETRILAESYNALVARVQQLLKEQEETAEQQRQQREELEKEVVQLMTDIEDASEGDLTVRARLMEGDIGIVADLFNAVVENLQETAQQVKTAASQVNSSLGDNEVEIRQLAEGAIAEAEEIQSTLNSIAQMNTSIQDVASNAQKAASIADTALTTAQEGNQAMDQTVQSIQSLRATVGETSKKMKQMGESAQKISQVVSLIDEISLKTSLLAINASVEANRAGELGQGFTAVAEQVEALAEQSASAAKEISQIVANIQSETQEAITTMEQGTSEVVESTRSVEETKARLADVVQRSEEINTLMQSISSSTVSQAETSQNVARLMEQVANSSQSRSQTSQEVAQAIQETAQVSKRLEESVQGFKVDKG